MPFAPIRVSTKPKPLRQAIDSFKHGVWRLVEDSRLPLEAVKEARNLVQVQDGRWSKRPGTADYGPDLEDTIDDAFEFVKEDGTTELMAIAGGSLYTLDVDGDSKTAVSGGTFTTDVRTRDLQIRGNAYLANGTDDLAIYDGSSISTYSNLSQPTISGITRTTLTSGSYTAYYQVVALNEVGHSLPSSQFSITVNKSRDTWGSGEKLAVAWGAVTGATRYEIYYNDDSGTTYYLDNVPDGVTSYDDVGTAVKNEYTEVPEDNTSLGPKFKTMELSGNRIWATQEPDNPYRVYFGGVGAYQGSFSAFYGGGWVDLEQGGRERPTAAVHYRDGKGSSQVTVFTSNPEGTGSIWQIELVDTTIGNVSFVIPNPVKIVGSTGTNAADAIVKTGDSVAFLNKRGIFVLGSRPNLLNVLSTREMSANIRPFVRSLNGASLDKACGYALDGRVYWSVPLAGSTENNCIMVLDTERNNWNPQAFTIGVRKFFEHTDNSGATHLLGIPTTGTRLIEIHQRFTGDGADAFDTSLLSGLYPVSSDRLEWARMQDVVFELFEPRGAITLQILGNEKRRGFTSLSSVTISNNLNNVNMGTRQFSSTRFGVVTTGANTFSRSTIKKRVRVNKLLNNWQYRITTTDKSANYTLLSVQPRGFIVPTRDPASWRSNT